MATQAVSGFGTIIQLLSGSAYNTIAEVVSISGASLSRNTIDITNMESTGGYKEFCGGLKDGGEISIEVNFLPSGITGGNQTQDELEDLLDSGGITPMRIIWSDKSNSQTATVNTTNEYVSITGHGFTTAQPVYISSSGTLPASTPQITSGQLYYVRAVSVDAFTLHTSSFDAWSNAGIINLTSSGTGTLTVITGAKWGFNCLVIGFDPKAELDNKLSATIKLKLTGVPTLPA